MTLALGDNGNCLTYAKHDLDPGPCVCFDCQDQLTEDAFLARVKEVQENRKLDLLAGRQAW